MAKRFYVVPKITINELGMTYAAPKYINPVDLPGVVFQAMNYGLEDTYLVGAEVTDAQHTALAANLDVIAIPANLDSTVGLTALTTVQNKLEGMWIPADWVTTSHTYRQVVALTRKAFLYMQRFHANQLSKFFVSGVTLDTRVNQLTQAQRNAMENAAISLGLSIASITGSMKLRAALKILFDQIPGGMLFGEAF